MCCTRSVRLGGWVLLGLLVPLAAHAQMQPVQLICEYLHDPLGVDAARPRLSWQLESGGRGVVQKAYQVLVASTDAGLAADQPDVWDSGRVESDQSLHIEYGGPPLASSKRYSWKVRVWDQTGAMTVSEPASWRTGLLTQNDWHGQWIGRTQDTRYAPAPLLRSSFELRREVENAQLFISGLGYYELRLNGAKVGDHVLDPGYTAFDRRVLYVSYDVTAQLHRGANAVGVILGTGWYNVHSLAVWGFDKAQWRAAPKLLLELRVTYDDGSSETIVSDETWKTSTGPITYDSIYGGESYDARLERSGGDTASFDDSSWQPALLVAPPGGELVSQQMPPVRVVRRLTPRKLTEPRPGVYVFDFGQNFAGVSELTVDAPAGTTITLRHGERVASDGSLDVVESMRHQRQKPPRFQTSEYTTAGGGPEIWSPRFTYYGFQYVEVSGLPSEPSLDTLAGLVIHTDVEPAGEFVSSNELLNRIQAATRWSYLSNLISLPTDCPQREKNAWTGDAHLAAEQALFNFKPAAVYSKWLHDLVDAQRAKGDLPGIAPTSGWGYARLNGPAWDSALLLIPAYMHQYYGDERILTRHYDAFKRYVDYVTSRAPGGIANFGLNDWVPYKTRTPPGITSTAYYYRDAQIVARTAELLGKHDEAEQYRQLAQRIFDAFNERFFDSANDSYGNGSQTSISCALYQGLVVPEHREAVTRSLVRAIGQHDDHIDTGVLGAKYVLLALMENGRTDLAYKVVDQKTLPGWGYWMQQGATTLWEDWKGTQSLNHIMFGDVSAWFYKAIAGINPDPAAPGWANVIIKPYMPPGMQSARATYDSIRGTIASAWQVDGARLTLVVEIPANSRAAIFIPTPDADSVREGGRPVSDAPGVRFVESADGYVRYDVGSGRYTFDAARPMP